MTLDDIRFLYAYTAWANERLFEASVALTPDAQIREVGGSFASVRDTWAHLASADWVWLCRWTGENPRQWPTWANGSVADIREEWRRIHAQRNEFIATLREDDLTLEIEFTRLNGEGDRARLAFLLQHVVNHATYHRGQVASQLRLLGAVPPSTDLLRFRPDQIT
ncbi:MAG: DinB family protein [Vicinamibacterales bacterium]|nr:hypothetical protein [Pseudorhodoplanes sp.]